MTRWKMFFSALVGLASFCAGVTGLHTLLDGQGGAAWADALTGASTLALIVVTAVYAYLTHLLVRGQQKIRR